MNKKEHEQRLNRLLKQMNELGIPYEYKEIKDKYLKDKYLKDYKIPLCNWGDLYIETIKELIKDFKEIK